MTTQFSPDRTAAPRQPTRFSAQDRPTPGNVGRRAGERALKQGAPKPQQRPPGQAKRPSEPLGHPDFGDGEEDLQDPSLNPADNRHIDLLGQHFNMKGLGRDVPFTVWAGVTGNYRQFAKEGQLPFDIFDDL